MAITTKLAMKYLIKNKRRSLITLIAIIITTILVTTVLAVLASYQKYMVNVERSDKNWEAEFTYIPYSKVKEIAKDENIKEVSIYYDFGESENISEVAILPVMIHLRAYSENALKNANLKLLEGRLPQNSNEVIVSNYAIQEIPDIGTEEEHIFNGITKKYTIVGIVDGEIEEDNRSIGNGKNLTNGAITYLDDELLNEETIVNVRVLAYNVKKIYSTTQLLVDKLNLKEIPNINKTQAEQSELISEMINSINEQLATELKTNSEDTNNEKVVYNTNLLNCELVTEADSSFRTALFVIGGSFIFIIAIASITVIYTTFKITYQERIKEFGVFSSIGMDKKQRSNMLLKEGLIIGTIGIIIGLILGIISSYFIVKLLQILVNNIVNSSTFFEIGSYTLRMKTNENAKMFLSIPNGIVVLIVFIIYIITLISAMLPMRKINKISPIEAIRNITKFKIKSKDVKSPNAILKCLGQEGELAYKNIRREKTKYRSIVISLTVSIIIFLVSGNFTKNLFADGDNKIKENRYEYTIDCSFNEKDEIINFLNKDNLIKDYYIYSDEIRLGNIIIPENKISDAMKEILKGDSRNATLNSKILEDGSLEMVANTFIVMGDAYNEILKRVGISELKEDEIIITNTTVKENSKYGDVIDYTKFKVRRYSYISSFR